MSDSEADMTNSNVFTFQNTTVSARGPNTNISNFNFRSRYVPRNFERQRYAESVMDQRSIYYRRETSPMSIHSACDFRSRNFQPYYNRMDSRQSVFNGRSGSPVSMRSIDSTASVSAADIAFALNNVKFNKYDLKVIKEAYQKAMKQRIRKRIEKRRNMRLFLKGNRHRSGDDSGEQGSDSSISSDDCRSVQTYNENMSCSKSTRINLTDFRKTVQENNMVNDCTESFRQNNFKNVFSMSTSNMNRNNTFNSSSVSKQIQPKPTQKDRFKNGFLLPSQRFNRSVASSVIPESVEKHHKNTENNSRQNKMINCVDNSSAANKISESSEDEIFSEKPIHNIVSTGKRNLDSDDDSTLPDKKRTKLDSPVKNFQVNRKTPSKYKTGNPINNNKENSNNFEFAKPTLPVRKSRPKIQEKVIAKCKQPLTGFVEHVPSMVVSNTEVVEARNSSEEKHIQIDNQIQIDQAESLQNSDVSMRPSFIKRKLFTQKLDVAEKANLSSDASNSPQATVYSGVQKEKNKARKLVANQSCLNRDVQEDNNLLDLIHKIVPPDRINITNQTMTNQTKIGTINSNKKDDDDDKWDVTSVISMCNENDVSDTFTDEEIFEGDNKNKNAKKKKTDKPDDIPKNTTKTTEKKQNQPQMCKVVVERINSIQTPMIVNQNTTNINVSRSIVKNVAKTFWDTDLESDAECQITTQKSFVKESQPKGNTITGTANQEFKHPTAVVKSPISKKKFQAPETSRWLNSTKNSTIMNSTLSSTRKLDISTLGVKSHRTTKKKKCCNETCIQETIPAKPVVVVKVATKPIVKNKIKTTEKSQATIEPNNNSSSKTSRKTETEKKTAKQTKPKSNAQKANKTRSSPRNSRESPKETKSKPIKKVDCSLDISKNQSITAVNNRPMRSCRTPSQNRSTENSRSSRQFDITPLIIMPHHVTRKQKRLNDSSYNESNPEINIRKPKSKANKTSNEPKKQTVENKQEIQDKLSTNSSKTKLHKQSNQSITLNTHKSHQSIKSKGSKQTLQNTSLTPRNDRPMRLCRTPSRNR